ncbi:MAG: tRNA1(Val) (adenine(37)-N6)-methyltransferase [Firmicutes bacterium]|nr:tRNA1(Val) (adenine(37)-N6)-methyltransferase [Bacillota bacterium]
MKVIHNLLEYNNLQIVQDTDYFNFSLDSVLLPNFVTLNKNISNILDLCTGNAPIPMILSTKTDAKIYGIELQKEIYDLARESIEINKLTDCITLVNKNINDIVNDFETETFDVITCNPPYFENHGLNRKNDNEIKSVARHEIHMQLEDIFKISKKLLKNSGVVAIVHRPERLVEIIETMKKYNIEPKRLQFIYPNESKESNMILIEGKKNGNKGLKILKPLFVHEDNGNYRKEILDMFK